MLLQKEPNVAVKEISEKDYKVQERRICSLKPFATFFPPKKRKKALSVKVSLCTSLLRRGSLAVETAFVLPLFFLGMVTLISFMDIYKLQTEHLSELCTKAKQTGMYAYLADGSEIEDITIPDIYAYEPFGGLVLLPKVITYDHVKVHAWTGATFEDHGDANENMEKMVYVTESGSVYHKDLSCSYLHLSLKQVSGSAVLSMSNQYGEHYSACETCSRGQKPAGVVYVTEQGNRYHNLETCSGLKRSVRLVKESAASGMCACSRCG